MPRVCCATRLHTVAGRGRSSFLPEARASEPAFLAAQELRQDELYSEVVRPFMERCLAQGCNSSIITYGGWGSGKSYTLGSLEPQQLTLTANHAENESAGVLLRCTQQLYERLGPNACVEITCVEVQGEDVADLLDPRAGAAMGRMPPGGGGGCGGGAGASSPGPGGPGSSPGVTRSPIAMAATKRKALTLTVARSLQEALLTLKRAVSYRQAFVTSTRHSSSRTHAVFQLRWRNPAAGGGAAGGCSGSTPAARPVAQQRPYSAPPRPVGPQSPSSAFAAAVGHSGAGGGAVCTLTLVDTCSFCALLPPKEGSAVKRSLLALGRVLSSLQRREALVLRESKLTRLLEGSLDQVLLLACLNGSSDEGTVQLVKLLHQGAVRDAAQRRMRRVSSSDSARLSAAWDPAGTPSVRSSISLRSSVNAGMAATAAAHQQQPHQPHQPHVHSHARQEAYARLALLQVRRQDASLEAAGTGMIAGGGQHAIASPPGSRSARYPASTAAAGAAIGSSLKQMAPSVQSPPPQGQLSPSAAAAVAAMGSRIGLGSAAAAGSPEVGSLSGRVRVRPTPLDLQPLGSEGDVVQVGATEGTEEEQGAAPAAAPDGGEVVGLQSPPQVIHANGGPVTPTSLSPAASASPGPSPAIGTSPGPSLSPGAPQLSPAAVAARQALVLARGRSVSGSGAVAGPGSGHAQANGGPGISERSPPSSYLRHSVSYRMSMGSFAVEGAGAVASGGGVGGGSTVVMGGARQRPAAVTARAAPGPDVRRSQGFSVLAGKWAPPPSPPPSVAKRDNSFPSVPLMLAGAATATGGGRGGGGGGARTPPSARSPASGVTPAPTLGRSAVAAASTAAAASSARSPSLGGPLCSPGAATTGSPSPTSVPTSPPGAAVNSLSSVAAMATASASAAASASPMTSPVATAAAAAPKLAPAAALSLTALRTPERAIPSPAATPTGRGLSSIAAVAAVTRSPASGGLTARRRSGIPPPPTYTPPTRSSPAPSSRASPAAPAVMGASAFSGAAVAPLLLAPSTSAFATSPAPALSSPASVASGPGRVVSIAAVGRPTLRASMRYSSKQMYDVMSEGGADDGGAAAGDAQGGRDDGSAGAASGAAVMTAGAAPRGAASAALQQQQQLPYGGPITAFRFASANDMAALSTGSRSATGMRSPSPMLRERRAVWLTVHRRSRSALPRPIAEVEGVDGEAGDQHKELRAGPATTRGRTRGGGGGSGPPQLGPGGVTLSKQYTDLIHEFRAFKETSNGRTPRSRRASSVTVVGTRGPAHTTVAASSSGFAAGSTQRPKKQQGQQEQQQLCMQSDDEPLSSARRLSSRFRSAKQLTLLGLGALIVADTGSAPSSGVVTPAGAAAAARASPTTASAVATPTRTVPLRATGLAAVALPVIGADASPVQASGASLRRGQVKMTPDGSMSLAAAAAAVIAASAAASTSGGATDASPGQGAGTPSSAAAQSPCRPPRHPGALPRSSATGTSAAPSPGRPRRSFLSPDSPLPASVLDMNLIASAAAIDGSAAAAACPGSSTPGGHRRLCISTVGVVAAGAGAPSPSSAALRHPPLLHTPPHAATTAVAPLPQPRHGPSHLSVTEPHRGGGGSDGAIATSAEGVVDAGYGGDDDGSGAASDNDLFGPPYSPAGGLSNLLGPRSLADLHHMLQDTEGLQAVRRSTSSSAARASAAGAAMAAVGRVAAASSDGNGPGIGCGGGGGRGAVSAAAIVEATARTVVSDGLPAAGLLPGAVQASEARSSVDADAPAPAAEEEELPADSYFLIPQMQTTGAAVAPTALPPTSVPSPVVQPASDGGCMTPVAAPATVAAAVVAAPAVTPAAAASADEPSERQVGAPGPLSPARPAVVTATAEAHTGTGSSFAAAVAVAAAAASTWSHARRDSALATANAGADGDDHVAAGSPVFNSSPRAGPQRSAGGVSDDVGRGGLALLLLPQTSESPNWPLPSASQPVHTLYTALGAAQASQNEHPQLGYLHHQPHGHDSGHLQEHNQEPSAGESVLCGSCNLTSEDLPPQPRLVENHHHHHHNSVDSVDAGAGPVVSAATVTDHVSLPMALTAMSCGSPGGGELHASTGPHQLPQPQCQRQPAVSMASSVPLTQQAHVRPHHLDLDDHSVVMVQTESESGSEAGEPLEDGDVEGWVTASGSREAEEEQLLLVASGDSVDGRPGVAASAAAAAAAGGVAAAGARAQLPQLQVRSQLLSPPLPQMSQSPPLSQQAQASRSPNQAMSLVRARIAALEASQGAAASPHLRSSVAAAPAAHAAMIPASIAASRSARDTSGDEALVRAVQRQPATASHYQADATMASARSPAASPAAPATGGPASGAGDGVALTRLAAYRSPSSASSAQQQPGQHKRQQPQREAAGVAAAWMAAAAAATSPPPSFRGYGASHGATQAGRLGAADTSPGTTSSGAMMPGPQRSPASAGKLLTLGSLKRAGGAEQQPVTIAVQRRGSAGGAGSWGSGGGTSYTASPVPDSPSRSTDTTWAAVAESTPTSVVRRLGSSTGGALQGGGGSGIGSPLQGPRDGVSSPALSARLRNGSSAGGGEGGADAARESVEPPPAYPPGFVHWATRVFSGGGAPPDTPAMDLR